MMLEVKGEVDEVTVKLTFSTTSAWFGTCKWTGTVWRPAFSASAVPELTTLHVTVSVRVALTVPVVVPALVRQLSHGVAARLAIVKL